MSHTSLVEEARAAGIQRFVVGAVILNNGRVLLLRRNGADFLGGLWELPSGVVGPSETLEQALRREVLEECGFALSDIGPFVGSFDYESKSGKRTRQFNFSARAPHDPTIRLSEHDASAWVDNSELRGLNVSSATLEIIRGFFRWVSPQGLGSGP